MSEKPIILFESYPDFNGSALAIYEELVKREYDKIYNLVWAVHKTFNKKQYIKQLNFWYAKIYTRQYFT